MSISTEIGKVLDLPAAIAMKEAQHKLRNTIMFVNHELVYVQDILSDALYVMQNDGIAYTITSSKIKALDIWLPDTGVYFERGTLSPVLLVKVAKRQWRRSFNEDSYMVKFLTTREFPTVDILPDSRTDFWIREGTQDIYWMDKLVGKLNSDGSAVCTYTFVRQEMTDWLRRTKHETP